MRFLWPLFTGAPGTSSMKASVRMPEATWLAVRASLSPFSERISPMQRLKNAWRALFPARHNQRITDFEARNAGFVST